MQCNCSIGLRSTSAVLLFLSGCSLTVDLDSNGKVSVEPTDSDTNVEPVEDELFHNTFSVTTGNDNDYFGYAVTWLNDGIVATANFTQNAAYGWTVDSTVPQLVTLETDGSDVLFDLEGAVSVIHLPGETEMGESFTCVSQPYATVNSVSNAGELRCFSDNDVVSGATLGIGNAALYAYGTLPDGYIGDELKVGDMNGDGLSDAVFSAGSMGAVYSGLIPSVASTPAENRPLVREVTPGAADIDMNLCDKDGDGDGDGSTYCQPLLVTDTHLVVSDSSDPVDGEVVEVWNLPIESGTPSASVIINDGQYPYATLAVETPYGILYNAPPVDEFRVVSPDLTSVSVIEMPYMDAAFGAAFAVDGEHQWLALGTPAHENSEGAKTGAVYVFDIAGGLPTSYEEAAWVAELGIDGNENCGYSLAFGTDVNGTLSLAVSCYDNAMGSMNNQRGLEVFTRGPAPAP